MDASSQPAIFFGTFPGNKKTNDLVTPVSSSNIKNNKAEESMFWGDQVEFEDDNNESIPEVEKAEEEQTKTDQGKEQALGDRVERVEIKVVPPTQVASSSTLNEELWPTLTSTAKSSELQKVVSAAAKIREEERARAKVVEDERKKVVDVNKEKYRVDNARKDVNGRGKKFYGYRNMAGRGRGDYKIVAPKPVMKPEPEKLVATKEKPKHPLAAQLLGIGFVEKKADEELDEHKEKRKGKIDVKENEKKAAEFARLQQEEIEKRKMRNAKKMLKRAEKKLMKEEREEMEDEDELERKEMEGEDKERKEVEDEERKVKARRKTKKKAAKKNVKEDNIAVEEPPVPPPASRESEPEEKRNSVMSKDVEDKERKQVENEERKVKAKRKTKKKSAKKNVKDDTIVAEVPPVSTLETIPSPASLKSEQKANQNSVMSKDLPLCKKKTARSLVLVITSLAAISATVISYIAFTDILF